MLFRLFTNRAIRGTRLFTTQAPTSSHHKISRIFKRLKTENPTVNRSCLLALTGLEFTGRLNSDDKQLILENSHALKSTENKNLFLHRTCHQGQEISEALQQIQENQAAPNQPHSTPRA